MRPTVGRPDERRGLRLLAGGAEGGCPRDAARRTPRLVRPRFEGDLGTGLFALPRREPDGDGGPTPPLPAA